MDLQPTLEGKFVKIRPLTRSDCDALYHVAKDPEIWEQHHSKRYLKTVFKPFFEESVQSKGALAILDKTDNKIIGSSRYKTLDGFPRIAEIGWTFIAKKYWGGKYNGEIKALMTAHAFRFVDHAIFIVDKNNLRSQRAMRKIGGKEISEIRSADFPKVSKEKLIFVINNPILSENK